MRFHHEFQEPAGFSGSGMNTCCFKDWFKKYTKDKATDEDSYYPQTNQNTVYIQVAVW